MILYDNYIMVFKEFLDELIITVNFWPSARAYAGLRFRGGLSVTTKIGGRARKGQVKEKVSHRRLFHIPSSTSL